ncbi:transposase [Candidatus Nitrotoga sp. M5]
MAPKRFLRAQTLPILYMVRTKRHLMEQINFKPLLSWFVGLKLDG